MARVEWSMVMCCDFSLSLSKAKCPGVSQPRVGELSSPLALVSRFSGYCHNIQLAKHRLASIR